MSRQRGPRAILQSLGAGTFGALAVLVVYAVVVPSTPVRRIAARDEGLQQLHDAVMPALLIAIGAALIVALVIAIAVSRRSGLSPHDLVAQGRGLSGGFFLFVAGGYLLAFRPMSGLFNTLDLRYTGETAWFDVSPPRIAFAVGVVAVWLWSSVAIGLAIRGSAASTRPVPRVTLRDAD